MRAKDNSHSSYLLSFIAITIAIAALYFGKEVLIPFALALLLSFLLSPPVAWLGRLKLPRPVAVVVILALASAVVTVSLWIGVTQLAEIVSQLPRYQENIRKKIEAMRNPAGNRLLGAAQNITAVEKELEPPAQVPEHPTSHASPKTAIRTRGRRQTEASTPIPVQIVRRQPSWLESLNLFGTPVAHLLASAATILIFTLFMLIQQCDLRNRFFRLFGRNHLNLMTAAIDDAARRVSRYLLTQALVNASFGVFLGTGLYWIGVPNPAFWGVLGALLRFIPYVGTLVAGTCPVILALAVFEGWAKPLMTAGLFALIELTLSAVVEPWLYGSHTGISSLAILVSAAFWTLLWGPIGLVLSTPLTVCLVVLGRHVPALQFFTVLLGDQPVLSPEARFYQRLLALDDDEAREIAETYLKDKSFGDLYDAVLIPALSLAEQDRHQNALDEERERFVFQSTREMLEDFASQPPPVRVEGEPTEAVPEPLLIACVPARDEADELAGTMLAHLLRQAGFRVDVLTLAPAEQMMAILREAQPNLVFVSALPPLALGHARSLSRRIRHKLPKVKIVVGLWDATADTQQLQQTLSTLGVNYVAATLVQAESRAKLVAEEIRLSKTPAHELSKSSSGPEQLVGSNRQFATNN